MGVGGRLRYFAAAWGRICANKFITDMVMHGYRLELVVVSEEMVPDLRSGMVAAIQDFLKQGMVVTVLP